MENSAWFKRTVCGGVIDMDEIVYTSAALLDLLRQIKELNPYDIDVSEQANGNTVISIGNSSYTISANNVDSVVVENYVVEQVSDIKDNTIDELVDSGELELISVESGIIKEINKTLLVGGLVRLTSKLLK